MPALRQLRRDARENARLLGRVAAAPEPGPWLGLVACAHDHKARIVELALAVLSESLQRHVFAQVRYALRSEDRRLRANAFEVLVSLPRSAVVAEAVEMLRFVLFEQPPEQAEAFDGCAVLALARTSRNPWVSEAARISLQCLSR